MSRIVPTVTIQTIEGVHVILNEANLLDVQADIVGPVDTPYAGGIFRCKLVIEADFPNNPPKGSRILNLGYFLTKIFHPNVSEKGEICVNTLKKDWNPQAWSLYNIFEVPFITYSGYQMLAHRSISGELPQRRGRQNLHGGLRGVF